MLSTQRARRPRRLVARSHRKRVIGRPIAGPRDEPIRPKRVKTKAQSGGGHDRDAEHDGDQGRRAEDQAERGCVRPAADELHRLQQGHGRRHRGHGRGHQHDDRQHRRLEQVGTTDGRGSDAGGAQSGDLGTPASELAGQPGEQVGQRDQGDADRDEQRQPVGARLPGCGRAAPRPRRTSRASRRRPAAARSGRSRGCRRAPRRRPGHSRPCRRCPSGSGRGRAACRPDRRTGTAPTEPITWAARLLPSTPSTLVETWVPAVVSAGLDRAAAVDAEHGLRLAACVRRGPDQLGATDAHAPRRRSCLRSG